MNNVHNEHDVHHSDHTHGRDLRHVVRRDPTYTLIVAAIQQHRRLRQRLASAMKIVLTVMKDPAHEPCHSSGISVRAACVALTPDARGPAERRLRGRGRETRVRGGGATEPSVREMEWSENRGIEGSRENEENRGKEGSRGKAGTQRSASARRRRAGEAVREGGHDAHAIEAKYDCQNSGNKGNSDDNDKNDKIGSNNDELSITEDCTSLITSTAFDQPPSLSRPMDPTVADPAVARTLESAAENSTVRLGGACSSDGAAEGATSHASAPSDCQPDNPSDNPSDNIREDMRNIDEFRELRNSAQKRSALLEELIGTRDLDSQMRVMRALKLLDSPLPSPNPSPSPSPNRLRDGREGDEKRERREGGREEGRGEEVREIKLLSGVERRVEGEGRREGGGERGRNGSHLIQRLACNEGNALLLEHDIDDDLNACSDNDDSNDDNTFKSRFDVISDSGDRSDSNRSSPPSLRASSPMVPRVSN